VTLGLPQRVQDKISPEPMSGCWLWTGAVTRGGYGHVYAGGGRRAPRYQTAHRFVYEALVSPLDPTLDLDHVCRNPACVNPAHLRPATRRENLLAFGSLSVAKANAGKQTCPRGHGYSPTNTYTTKRNQRICKTCRRRAA
jgi:hypothetical protein